jgi:hypothetical protein
MEPKDKKDRMEVEQTLKTRMEKELQKAELMPSTGFGKTVIHWENWGIVRVEVTKSVKLKDNDG